MESAKAQGPLFRTLSGGRGGMGRGKTERHQRGRLEGAMVEAVSRHGYAETTVGELVALAGVSKSTFYQHFASKDACFFATFETIVEEASVRVSVAYRSEDGLRERLAAAMARLAEILAEESAAASLVMVDSLSLGQAAIEPRERAAEAFELMVRQSFASSPGGGPTDLAVRAIVAGMRRVVYRCLRAGCPEEVGEHVSALLEWALSYQGTDTSAPLPFSPRPRRRTETIDANGELSWEEPADSPKSRTSLTQRERIIRATAQVVAKSGYASLTIPAISAASGTSNQTFYEHFEGKEQAFLAAFDELSRGAMRATAAGAGAGDAWQSSVEAGIRGLLEHLVAEPLFTRLAFFELPTAGATALDRADLSAQRFTAFFEPRALPDGLAALPPVVVEAIGGGMWAVIQHEIAAGRLSDLPAKAPEIAAIALTPFTSPRASAGDPFRLFQANVRGQQDLDQV
jgi:AcrR family transcriptional regulator